MVVPCIQRIKIDGAHKYMAHADILGWTGEMLRNANHLINPISWFYRSRQKNEQLHSSIHTFIAYVQDH